MRHGLMRSPNLQVSRRAPAAATAAVEHHLRRARPMAALHAFLATCRSPDGGSPAAQAQPASQPPAPRRAPGNTLGRAASRPGGAGGGGSTLALTPRQARRLARLVRQLALACHADLQARPQRTARPALWPPGLPLRLVV